MNDKVSIIYYQKNDSPKYFEIKKSFLYWLLAGIPTLAVIFFALNLFGIFNLISNKYTLSKIKLSSHPSLPFLDQESREWQSKLDSLSNENERLRQEIDDQKKLLDASKTPSTSLPSTPIAGITPSVTPTPPSQMPESNLQQNTSKGQIGIDQFMLFQLLPQFKDKTRPAQISLSGFNTLETPNSLNFQFNIIPNSNNDDGKISGHIIVLMKNSSGIFAYPESVLSTQQIKILVPRGESFSTQRFRPVSASFYRPRKTNQNIFFIYIFDRNQDLIHFQTITLPARP